MIGMARALLVDPDLPNKVAADGANAKLVKCIRCNVCDRRIRASLGIRCQVLTGKLEMKCMILLIGE